MTIQRIMGIALASAGLVVACGTASTEAPSDEYAVEASAASRSELGVASWRGHHDGDSEESTVRGVGEDGRTVLQIDSRNFLDGDVRRLRTRVTRGSESEFFEVRIRRTGGDVAHRISSTLPEGPRADAIRRSLELMGQDMEAGPRSRARLRATGLRPTDSSSLVEEGDTKLVEKCSWLTQCNNQQLNCILKQGNAIVGCGWDTLIKTPKDLLTGWIDDKPLSESATEGVKECADRINKGLDACDTLGGSVHTGCKYGGTDNCPDPSKGAPNQQCSPACDAVHSCSSMGDGTFRCLAI